MGGTGRVGHIQVGRNIRVSDFSTAVLCPLGVFCASQERLLEAAAQCVRPGGSLTYSVCTPIAREVQMSSA